MTKLFIGIAIIAAVFYFNSCQSNTSNSKNNIVGVSPIQNVFLLENHNEALVKYKAMGIKNGILVHVDTHIDMNWLRSDELDLIVNEKNIQKLQGYLKTPEQFYIPGEKFIHVGNWIFPLLMDSTISEFYWVVPDKNILSAKWLNLFKKGLQLFQDEMTADEIASFKVNNSLRRIEGRMYGKAVIICTVQDLPEFSVPVVLDIDTDYFNFNSAIYLERINKPFFWPDEFLAQLAKKKITSNLVTISYSVNDGYLTPELRFLAEDLDRRIRSGKNISDADIERSQAAQSLYLFLKNLNKQQPPVALKSILLQFPADAAIHYLASQIYARQGNKKQAIENLKIAAHLDKQYKYALLHKANQLFYDRNYGQALRYYSKIDKKRLAQSGFVKYRIGSCYQSLGMTEQAQTIFAELIERNLPGVTLFKELGNLYLRANNFQKAEAVLKKGLELDPFNRDINFSLGQLYVLMNKPYEAKNRFQNCLKYYPTYPAANFQLKKISKSNTATKR